MPPTLPSREQIESMAFMAMMDGIGIGHISCNCPSCKGDRKARPSTRPQPAKRADSGNEVPKPAGKHENHTHNSRCTHGSTDQRSPPVASKKPSPSVQPQDKTPAAAPVPVSNNPQGREHKVNTLLKAFREQAVFEVFNMTAATKEETDLAHQIQTATKNCKLYTEVKNKVMEICEDEEVELESVFGLLAKFRHERNLLTTAILKSNTERVKHDTEREKALLCIKRVDDLMYMLQDVARRPKDLAKDADGDNFMHKLGDIIMEIHDLAKAPSTLYDELLDIKDEHEALVEDHEEMHHKFVEVNSCHDKLHANHDKLQTTHTKLMADFTDTKKKAGLVGGLRNDVNRLEKLADKARDENINLKKEVEKLNAELVKVNALKHENAQLKKKVATLVVAVEETKEIVSVPPSESTSVIARKKKGKKGQGQPSSLVSNEPMTNESDSVGPVMVDAATEKEFSKLKVSHESILKELDVLKANLAQLETLRRKAESRRDQVTERLEVEQAKCQNWQEIAQSSAGDKEQLRDRLSRSQATGVKLQSTVDKLEQNLTRLRTEMAEQKEAYMQIQAELDQRPQTPAISVASQSASVVSQDTIRLLRKIKAETTQLARDLEDSISYGGDPYPLMNMIQYTVRKVANDVEKDIEEIMSVRSGAEPSSQVPETVFPSLPFGGASNVRHLSNQSSNQHSTGLPSRSGAGFSPQTSPSLPFTTIPASSALPSYRPMIPPGFGDSPNIPTPSSSLIGLTRGFTPSSTASLTNTSPVHHHNYMQNPPIGSGAGPGPIGSRSTNGSATAPIGAGSRNVSVQMHSNMTPSPIGTPAPASAPTTTATIGPGTIGEGSKPREGSSGGNAGSSSTFSSLGNGAVGVDWSMWSKNGK